METLLLVDDDPLVLDALRLHFEEQRDDGKARYRVVTADTAAGGLDAAERERPALIILDMLLPDRSGIDLLPDLKASTNGVPVVVITGHHDLKSTILAMRAGAFDYLHKPFPEPETLNLVVERALEMSRVSRRAAALAIEEPQAQDFDDIVGTSPMMQALIKEVGRVAASRTTVLIQGESGTGKELLARVIHNYSADGPRPFVAINCSAIVETLLESELFGHEKGSFTGAAATKPGKLELAGDGTLFLDEIGDMSPRLQAKLLRVLQEREFERVGGLRRLPLVARVIAATHRNLADEVAQGRFRDDLYQRLKVVTLFIPPLRERREDIPPLVSHLLARINEKVHKRVTLVPESAMERLCALPWQGNVRELENVLTRAVVLAPGDVLLESYFPQPSSPTGGVERPEKILTLEELEREHIARVLRDCRGHRGRACQLLGISRPTLERKLRKYELKEPPLRGGAEDSEAPAVKPARET
jgi:two-component system response regulator AtoC